jgi:hypothetical protein
MHRFHNNYVVIQRHARYHRTNQRAQRSVGVDMPGPEVNEPIILGIGIKAFTGAALGSAAGMVLGTGTIFERLVRGTVGAGAAYIGHPMTAKIFLGVLSYGLPKEYLPMPSDMEPVSAFFIGLVGMVVCQAAINMVSEFRDDTRTIIKRRIDKDL